MGILVEKDQKKIYSLYEGQFLNNKKQGLGRLIFENGETYEGNFKNDRLDGNGIYTYQNGKIVHKGQFKNGKFHEGVKYLSDGSTKDGESTDEKEDGMFRIIKADGTEEDEKWKKGEMLIP